MHFINARNCLEAWRKTSNYLLSKGRNANNILIDIEKPCAFRNSWLDDYNPKTISHSSGKSGDNIHDVIHTIFPRRFARRYRNREDLYAYYLKTHLRSAMLSGKKNNRWGTYFTRLICFEENHKLKSKINSEDSLDDIKDKYKNNFAINNQLERVIYALSNWQKAHKAALYCHISAPNIDSVRPIGSPCLQYIQFSQHDTDNVDMIVVYRNHDYFNKAFGNFIGLGQLLNFICNESGKTPGKLTCHSIHAYIGVSIKKMELLLTRP